MKKIIFTCRIFIMLMTFIGLCGCSKCIRTDTKMVEVKIIDEYYRGAYLIPIRTGKVTTVITNPAVYTITVEYNGVKYTIYGSDTYNKYNDKIGRTANGELQIKYYDDESIKYDIISLE